MRRFGARLLPVQRVRRARRPIGLRRDLPRFEHKIGCFDTFSDASKRRGAGSDAESIVSMINYVKQNYNGDPARVYATGSSSGA